MVDYEIYDINKIDHPDFIATIDGVAYAGVFKNIELPDYAPLQVQAYKKIIASMEDTNG